MAQDKKTKRVSQYDPSKHSESLWHQLTKPETKYPLEEQLAKIKLHDIEHNVRENVTPNMLYNDADAAEDTILFPDDAQGIRQNAPFREITNPAHAFEASPLPPAMLRRKPTEESLARPVGDLNEDGIVERSEGWSHYVKTGLDDFVYSVPPIWKQAFDKVTAFGGAKDYDLLKRVDYYSQVLELTPGQVRLQISTQEIIERDRSFGELYIL